MRMPYRTKLAECREAMRRFRDLCRFETKQVTLNDGAGILDGWFALILVWAAGDCHAACYCCCFTQPSRIDVESGDHNSVALNWESFRARSPIRGNRPEFVC